MNSADPRSPEYDYPTACMVWARELNEVNLRSLAADYLRGVKDDDCRDAFHEFERRFGKHNGRYIPSTPRYIQRRTADKAKAQSTSSPDFPSWGD